VKDVPMRDVDDILARLSRSAFRRKFVLRKAERTYIAAKGLPTVIEHAGEIIAARMAAAEPHNDGKQTPFRGHPVFVAQHATATCCRGCLAKWHGIPKGRPLSEGQQSYVVSVIAHWLRQQLGPNQPPDDDPRLL
jgi:hypothetical protein